MDNTISTQATEAHLNILQSIIQRMATNSSSAKTSCITIVSAILVIIADKGKPHYAWVAIIPTVLFFILDSYYLALEKGFRGSYNEFITKLHANCLEITDLYVVAPKGKQINHFFSSIVSFSVWPFYTVLLVMVYIAKIFVI